MNTRLAAALLFVAAQLSAQQQKSPPRPAQQPAQSDPSQSMGGYQGTVVSTTGVPVGDARLMLQSYSGSQQTQSTVSSLDDKFVFAQLDPGRYFLRVIRPGFIMSNDKQRGSPSIEVKAGDVVTGNITMAPESSITGRVINSDGEPVEFASVQAVKIAQFQAGRTTNERGEFRLYGLAPGKYLVRATPAQLDMRPEIRSDGSREQQDIPTFYPNSTAIEGAMRVEVPDGGSATGIEIRLQRAPVVGASGSVRNADEKDYPNFILESGYSRSGMLRAPRFKDGHFSFLRIAPGKYSLVAFVYGESGFRRSSTPLELEIGDQDLQNLDIDLQPPMELEGRIRWTDEDKGKTVNLQEINLYDNTRIQFNGMPRGQINPDNTFKITGVMRDRYPITIRGNAGPYPVQSVEIGGVDAPDRLLDVRQGATGPVTIVLSTDTGDIAGTISSPKPFSIVLLMADRSAGMNRARTARPDANGAFQFKSIPIGEYKIVVVDERDSPEITSSGKLGFYEVDAKEIKLRPNDSLTIDLKQP